MTMSKTRKSQQSLKGKYTLLNPEKYTGNPKKIVFRSMWERKFMLYCDKTPEVLEWSSEEIVIPYYFNEKDRNYYPDFYIKFIKDDDTVEESVIEIKPYYQRTYEQNKAKWRFAEEYCKKHNYTFKILTERELF
jgi:hypothetical protein